MSRFEAGGAQSMESQASDTTTAASGMLRKHSLNPRTPIKPRLGEMDSSEDDDGDDDGPARQSLRGRKRKSILQPKGSKFSKKAAGRRNNLHVAQMQNDDEEDDGDQIVNIASPIITAMTNNHTKRQPPTDRKPPEALYHEYLPSPYVEVRLVHYDLPTDVPQGPGDLWTCEFEGCMKRVYEGSTEAGEERIKQHLRDHEASAKEKIDLVMDERRPYLPVE